MESQKMYDVIVAGGGLAGTCSAVAAAKQGKKVLLIERYGFLGGMAAAGLVNPFMPYSTYDKEGNRIRVNNAGLFRNILYELDSRGSMYSREHSHIKHEEKSTFNEEVLKKILDEITENNGVDVLFHSFVFRVDKENSMITSVSSVGKSGVIKHRAGFFIDATGDADLCALADCDYMIGRREDGKCQPMTLCFRIGNVEPYMAEKTLFDQKIREKLNEVYKSLQTRGEIKNQRENILIFPHMANGVIHFNSTRIIEKSGLDPYELSMAEREARKQAEELVAFFRKYAKGFENCLLLQTAPQIGIRETRRIRGKYILTENDLVKCVKFNDSIARGCYPVDIHNPSGKGTRIRRIPTGDYYTIPYRCIVPIGIKNMVIAGRPVSSTHEAHSAVRVMPICANIGEAAGIAAAMCVEKGIYASDIDTEELHTKLTEAGAIY